MTPCFADTSYFIALLSPTDGDHARARQLAEGLRQPVLTSEYVIIEVGNFFRAAAARAKFASFLHAVECDPGTQIVAASSTLLRAAIALFVERQDKTWSLTDCTSFVIMQNHGVTHALSADHHFEQAGFRALLRSDPR